MKFKTYINEQSIPLTDEEIYNFIQERCKPYLKERGFEKSLYRGLKESLAVLIRHPRKDRKPRNMSPSISVAIDNILKKQIGWKPRSEGVFVTPIYFDAESYGNPYVVFPIGDFKYVYFSDIEDTIELSRNVYNEIRRLTGFDPLDSEFWEYKKDFMNTTNIKNLPHEKQTVLVRAVRNVIKENPPRTTQLKHVRKEEITIKCKSYLSINPAIYKKINQ